MHFGDCELPIRSVPRYCIHGHSQFTCNALQTGASNDRFARTISIFGAVIFVSCYYVRVAYAFLCSNKYFIPIQLNRTYQIGMPQVFYISAMTVHIGSRCPYIQSISYNVMFLLCQK